MTKRLLVAGYGFLGRVIGPAFVSHGWHVDGVNRSGSDGAVSCDLGLETSTAAIEGDYDLVIHCAASGGGDVDSYRDVYVKGCQNLIARFSDTPLIFTSSTSVYPQTDHALVTELSAAESTSPRARLLREAENAVLEAGGIVARLTGLYGRGRCHVLKNFLAGTAVLDGAGERIMNFVHCEDVARALVLLAKQGVQGEIYNVNGGYASQRQVYESLVDHFGLPLPPQADPNLPRKRGNTSKQVSNAKLKQLGWSPEYDDFLKIALACDVQ